MKRVPPDTLAAFYRNNAMTTRHPALAAVQAHIAAKARDVGRNPAMVTLVAVSKTFGEAEIVPVLEAGQRVFGENRVQEAKAKWPALRERFAGVELHLIGPLQSNKAREAVALFDAIHTIDRPKIARAIAEEMAHQQRRLQLFIEVNTGDEPQQSVHTGISYDGHRSEIPVQTAVRLSFCHNLSDHRD